MSRYRGDPLSSIISQFPMTSPRFAPVIDEQVPSGPDTRPWGLRWLRPSPTMIPPAYSYCPERQTAVGADGAGWLNNEGKEWSSIAERDGDEGPSEDYGWDTDGDVS